eukprot:8974581-Pyramimonas_sp.AAC.1
MGPSGPREGCSEGCGGSPWRSWGHLGPGALLATPERRTGGNGPCHMNTRGGEYPEKAFSGMVAHEIRSRTRCVFRGGRSNAGTSPSSPRLDSPWNSGPNAPWKRSGEV